MTGAAFSAGWPQAIVALVALQRGLELVIAARNTRALRRQGAGEVGAGHYPILVGLHAGWLLALFVLVPAASPINGPLLALFAGLQAARVWVIASLGRFWTTRIITLPGAPLVRHGPYRWCRHPNYAVVVAELAVLPLVFGRWDLAIGFSAANLAVLAHRIRVEQSALRQRPEPGPPPADAGTTPARHRSGAKSG